MNCFGSGATSALTVVTKDHKYTYWWYGDSEMEPTEELFHLTKDPLEMTNLAQNPEAQPLLETMRKNYDFQLKHWQAQAIPNSKHAKLGELFDRSLPLEKKKVRPAKKSKTKANDDDA